jgi:hypothetical protein
MAKSRAGGGIQSKNVVKKGVRTAAPRERVRVAGAAQIGQAQGNHITGRDPTDYRGIGVRGGAGYPSRMGNEVAASTKCGPGGSRTVYRSGTQQNLQAAKPPSATRDTLAEFGPESSAVRRK